jgi:methyl-accepting chemotaxis protein
MARLSDFSIATRLHFGFAAVVLMLIILASVSVVNGRRTATANEWNVHTFEVLAEAHQVLEGLINIETGERGFAITGKDGFLEPYNNGQRDATEHLGKLRKLTADNPTQQRRLEQVENAYRNWISGAIDPVIQLRRQVVAGTANMDAVAALEGKGTGKTSMDAMRQLLGELEKDERSLLGERGAEAARLQSLTENTLAIGALLAATLAATVSMWLARNITGPLREAVALSERVAKGDLTSRIDVRSDDETGQLMSALSEMNEALSRIVHEVRGGTGMINMAAVEIASGNNDLSSRTEQQASALEETASSMEELTSTVKQNAENARHADDLARNASEVAARGGQVVSQVVEKMATINASAQKIVDIIAVIDGIAFQTNILALNAAVEAARAGEQGRGFAVVAGEVRNLAQRSATAAKEIKALIDTSVGEVEAGSKLVGVAGDTMGEVVSSVRRVSDIINNISAASEEQQSGIEQINEAIVQMETVTQQNAALVEQAAAAASAMEDQANKLTELVEVFTVAGSPPSGVATARALRQPNRRLLQG